MRLRISDYPLFQREVDVDEDLIPKVKAARRIWCRDMKEGRLWVGRRGPARLKSNMIRSKRHHV